MFITAAVQSRVQYLPVLHSAEAIAVADFRNHLAAYVQYITPGSVHPHASCGYIPPMQGCYNYTHMHCSLHEIARYTESLPCASSRVYESQDHEASIGLTILGSHK